MKRIVFTARDRGFGPVSKTITIAKLFTNSIKTYMGVGNSVSYAKKSNVFSSIINIEDTDEVKICSLLVEFDFCISVMEQDIAILCFKIKVKYYFFDSLFGYWLSNIREGFFEKILSLGKSNIENHLHTFSSHEKKIIAHYLANKSFIQVFYDYKDIYKIMALV